MLIIRLTQENTKWCKLSSKILCKWLKGIKDISVDARKIEVFIVRDPKKTRTPVCIKLNWNGQKGLKYVESRWNGARSQTCNSNWYVCTIIHFVNYETICMHKPLYGYQISGHQEFDISSLKKSQLRLLNIWYSFSLIAFLLILMVTCCFSGLLYGWNIMKLVLSILSDKRFTFSHNK